MKERLVINIALDCEIRSKEIIEEFTEEVVNAVRDAVELQGMQKNVNGVMVNVHAKNYTGDDFPDDMKKPTSHPVSR